ncbi:MAG: hypothetical protein PHE27_09045 [Alphaproteobacteria bacterium]|nr:hypothetical protein [Alphaproteobacteria bacterium]
MTENVPDNCMVLDVVSQNRRYAVPQGSFVAPTFDQTPPVDLRKIQLIEKQKTYKHEGTRDDYAQTFPFDKTVATVSISAVKDKMNVLIADEQRRFNLIAACKAAGNELVAVGNTFVNPDEVEKCDLDRFLHRRVIVEFHDGSKWKAPKGMHVCAVRQKLKMTCTDESTQPK